MRIAMTSHFFHPLVGGIVTMSLLLAQEFTRLGHEVVVITQTPSPLADNFPFKVLRHPAGRELLNVVRWCDVFFQNNISLQTLWPLLLIRRPWVVAHHTWIRRSDGSLGWQDHIKRCLLRLGRGITISQAMADDIPVQSEVIANPYLDTLFRVLPDVEKDRDLVFLGRLVSDKGATLLIEALHHLKLKGLAPSTTIIGAGPELGSMQQRVAELQLSQQVEFAGQKAGEELVYLLNRHRIMVVPSVWNEPFGIVALEGIACGCAIVGSAGGGLKDAIGPCGITFQNGNVAELSLALEKLLRSPETISQLMEAAPPHLHRHTLARVADRYLQVLASATAGRA